MKEEHYTHVSSHFNLEDLSKLNSSCMWVCRFEGTVSLDSICVHENRGTYSLRNNYNTLFILIPTKELAEEILTYIKETEVLFV